MLEIKIAISPQLEKRVRAAIARKADLIVQFEAGKITQESSKEAFKEVARLDMFLSRFGESVFGMADAMNQQELGRDAQAPAIIH